MNSYVHSVGFGEQSTDVLLSRENFYMEIICLKLLVGPHFQLILLLCPSSKPALAIREVPPGGMWDRED